MNPRRFISATLLAAFLLMPVAACVQDTTEPLALDKPAVECVDLRGAEYCKYPDGTFTRNGLPIMVQSTESVNADSQELPPIWLPIVRGSTFWATYGTAIEVIAGLGWASLVVLAFYGPEIVDALRDAFEEEQATGNIECGTVDMYFTCWA